MIGGFMATSEGEHVLRQRLPYSGFMNDAKDRLNEALAGRYAVDREIGRGGAASVWLADDSRHHRSVAIKVLNPDLAVLLGATRFLREIEIIARLNHPHILPLFDSGEVGG